MATQRTDPKCSLKIVLEVGSVGGKPKTSARSIGYITPTVSDDDLRAWGDSLATQLITYPLSALDRVDTNTLTESA